MTGTLDNGVNYLARLSNVLSNSQKFFKNTINVIEKQEKNTKVEQTTKIKLGHDTKNIKKSQFLLKHILDKTISKTKDIIFFSLRIILANLIGVSFREEGECKRSKSHDLEGDFLQLLSKPIFSWKILVVLLFDTIF